MRGIKLIGQVDGDLVIQYVEPKAAYENGRRSKKQAKNDSGVPLWRVTCLHTAEGERPEIVYVNMASENEPAYEIGDELEKAVFAVKPYDRNGRVEYSLTLLRTGETSEIS